jgi:hypothetical protein
MPERADRPEDQKPDTASMTPRPWTRPTLTRMDAADAELGTRPTGPDGSFSVS